MPVARVTSRGLISKTVSDLFNEDTSTIQWGGKALRVTPGRLYLTQVERLRLGGHCSLVPLTGRKSWARGLQSWSLLRFPGRWVALLWNINDKKKKETWENITSGLLCIDDDDNDDKWCTTGHPFPRLSLQTGHHYSQRLGALSAALRKVGQALRTERAAGGRVRVLRVVHRHAADDVRPLANAAAER